MSAGTYYVSHEAATPDERGPGWFWVDEITDEPRGPYPTRERADESFAARRRIVTEHVYPPVPSRDYDWSATLDCYDEGDPIGRGPTKEAAIADLQEQLTEEA